jgi:hypothetical protein
MENYITSEGEMTMFSFIHPFHNAEMVLKQTSYRTQSCTLKKKLFLRLGDTATF